MEAIASALTPLIGMLAVMFLVEAFGGSFGKLFGDAIRYLCFLLVLLGLLQPLRSIWQTGSPGNIGAEEGFHYSAAEGAERTLAELELTLGAQLREGLCEAYKLQEEDLDLRIRLRQEPSGVIPEKAWICLHSLRAVAKKDLLQEALSKLGCPVEWEEDLRL